MDKKPTISVIGAGAWGTALAQTLSSDGSAVMLWTRFKSHASEINAAHENKRYLQGVTLNKGIRATHELEIALQSDIILLVTPTQALRSILNDMKGLVRSDHKMVLCCKGIEQETGKLTTEILSDIFPNHTPAIISGPNFAIDIAAGRPAATTLACADCKIAELLQLQLNRLNFRPYICSDIIGVQIAGAIKNVIAIACGIAHGKSMGESARASLITRGLAETARLGVAMGAQYETFLGLSGVGDLMLTCTSQTSRNFSLGYDLGQGKPLQKIIDDRKTVSEGIFTSISAKILADKFGVDMPISGAVHKCLHKDLPLDHIIENMLNRPLGHEL